MTVTEYTIHDFDYNKALNGALCIIVSYSCMHPTPPDTPPSRIGDDNANFFGAGIVRKDNPNRLVLVTKGIAYYFKDNGDSIAVEGTPSHPTYLLKLGTVEDPDIEGSLVNGVIVPDNITRSENDSTIIDNLSPKDQFAIQALQSMMSKISDPSILSSSEMDNYCKAAYLWADNMMRNAAMLRVGVIDNLAPAASNAQISSLDNNTERLLNNLIVELSGNDKASDMGVWSKEEQTSVNGEHTDAWLTAHPLEGTYTTVATAEAAGWSWTANYYSDRQFLENLPDVKFKDVTMSGLEALIKQLRGVYNNGGTEAFYNESLFEHYLRGILTSYVNNNNITTDYPNTTVGLRDLIKAIANISVSGGTVNVDLTTLNSGVSNNKYQVNNSGEINIGSTGLGRNAQNPIYVSGIGGGVDKNSATLIQSGDTYTIEDILVFKYSNLSTSLFRVNMADLGVPVLTSTTSIPSSPNRGYYYRIGDSSTLSTLSSVSITLPAVSNHSAGVVGIIMYHFACSADAPFSVTVANSGTVKYRESNPGSTLAAGTYEVDCVDNGLYWIVGVTKLVSQNT